MSRDWTKEQREAIESETQNILVSAGAGSGKTAVLTQRVINLLSKKININELLVLTFTNAAAAEMKERIRKAIKKEEDLKEQLDLLDSAYITTFDSYALSLVKKYHYLLNVSNNVKIVNEAALKLEKYKIIDEVMEEKYANKSSDFTALINHFCLKDDEDFKTLIFELNDKFDLIIEKEDFLNNYNNYLNESKVNKLWNDYYSMILSKFELLKDLYYEIENSLESNEDELLFEDFSKALERLIDSNDYNDIISNINFDLSKFRKTKNINETFLNNKRQMGVIRNEIKDLSCPEKKELILSSLKENLNYEKEIIDIIKEVNLRVDKLKFENEMFEFIDIAKLAIKLLKNNPSICDEIKNSIKEIMLDEYQDTSDIQETLIGYIANNNVYMVGDIKQSIYRFRNANPKIFSDKYETYSLDESKGKVINLMKNFRSRKEVLDDINILFNKIMSIEHGGVNYSKGHEFVFGNLSYDSNVFDNQSNNLEVYSYTKDKDLNYSRDEIEAFIIGQDIKNKIENNYMVYDKDKNVQRKLEYGDITILIDRKEPFDTYQKIFEYLEIPMSSYKNTNLTFSNELLCFKNIYKLILKYYKKEFDSEFKHSFMSVARSFLFEYNDDYLFDIISKNSYFENSIYEKLKEVISSYEYLSISQINDYILDKLDVFYRASNCEDIESITATIHYIYGLINDLSAMGYNLEMVVEYFDSVITREFKIELPVRKNTMNSVKIMTIHGSKGLEFNICYFAGFNKKFSEFDSKKKFIYDDQYGMLLPMYINNEKYPNIGKKLYFDRYYKEEISEKIRLLYVALSRAKEKMIIVGDFSDSKKETMDETRSFYDLIKYGQSAISNNFKYIELKDYDITERYKYYKNLKNLVNEETNKLMQKEIKITKEIVEETSFSKKQNELINEETVSLLNKGNKLHSILEKIDFSINELNKYKLSNDERRILERFINCDLLKNKDKGKIYKEYEFIYEDNKQIKHGFIDLMIVYENYIDIIDYKLSNIEDEAYAKQLEGYRIYIQKITNKSVNIYLYSLFKGGYIKV